MRKTNKHGVTLDSIASQLEATDEFLSANTNKLILDRDHQIANFLFDCYGSSDIPAVATRYSNDIISLNLVLEGLANHVSDKNLKARILRIKKRLTNSD